MGDSTNGTSGRPRRWPLDVVLGLLLLPIALYFMHPWDTLSGNPVVPSEGSVTATATVVGGCGREEELRSLICRTELAYDDEGALRHRVSLLITNGERSAEGPLVVRYLPSSPGRATLANGNPSWLMRGLQSMATTGAVAVYSFVPPFLLLRVFRHWFA